MSVVLVNFSLLLINRQRSKLLPQHCRIKAVKNKALFALLVIQISPVMYERMVGYQKPLTFFKMICTYTVWNGGCFCMLFSMISTS